VVTEITYESTYNTYPATTRIRINPGADGGSDLVTTTSYDARSGLATSVTDPNGRHVANTYDAFYRLTGKRQDTRWRFGDLDEESRLQSGA